VSSAVSHLVSTSGVCPVKSRHRAFQSMSRKFCGRCAAATDKLHVVYQCLALEPDALLTYVSIVIPKKSIDTTVNRGTFSCSKYTKIGERSQRGTQDGSGTQDCG